jgi:hypothetical protein
MTKKHMENDRLNSISLEIATFQAAIHQQAQGMIKIPTGGGGGTNWGLYQKLKKEKSRILSVINERFNRHNAKLKGLQRKGASRHRRRGHSILPEKQIAMKRRLCYDWR